MTPAEAAAAYDHPCRETCSGWKQGYDKGFAFAMSSPEVLAIRDAPENTQSYLDWNADNLSGDDLIGDGRLTARYKQALEVIADALSRFAKQPGVRVGDMKCDKWPEWWFLNGGNIHGAWKYRRYSQIRDLAMSLPRRAWQAARAELFKSIIENLDEIGPEETIDWIRARGTFEIEKLKPTPEASSV